ncbi:hypothetical protein BDN72DRAFT_767627, partial [Pluteus cervinus]
FVNKCGYGIQPAIANTNCGYSPRCNNPGSGGVWNGRVFAKASQCGGAGENCSIGEFNLDTGDNWTPQAYDISNIQGFSQSLQIAVGGCDTVTCTSPGCSCTQAYPIGDTSGCGNDSPVRGCGAGDKTWQITFCP